MSNRTTELRIAAGRALPEICSTTPCRADVFLLLLLLLLFRYFFVTLVFFFFFFCSVVDLSSFLNARARARARHYLTETRGESATQRRQYCFAIGKALPRVHWTLVRKTNRTADRSFEISLLLLLLLLLLVFVLWSTVFDCAGPLVWSQCVFLIFPTNYSLIFIRIFLFLLVFL